MSRDHRPCRGHASIAASVMIATALATALAGPQPRQAGSKPTVPAAEALVACGKQLFKRPVYLTADSQSITLRFPCPSSTAEYIEALRRADLRVIESAASVILVPEWRFMPSVSQYHWTSATVRVVAGQGRLDDAGRELSPEDLAAAVKTIVDEARTPPLGSLPFGKAGESISTEIDLDLIAVPLQKGVHSIAALWGRPGGYRRLVYGVVRDGRYVLKWDSPILSGREPTLTYADVDGDGVAEIAITSLWGRGSMMVNIFSTTGRELTRQVDCETNWSEHPSDRAAVSCPVVGREVILEDAVMGERPLWVDDGEDGFRMMLKNGRYVRTGR